MSERSIWTAGMEVIERALLPQSLETFRQDEIRRQCLDAYKAAVRNFNKLRRPGDSQ